MCRFCPGSVRTRTRGRHSSRLSDCDWRVREGQERGWEARSAPPCRGGLLSGRRSWDGAGRADWGTGDEDGFVFAPVCSRSARFPLASQPALRDHAPSATGALPAAKRGPVPCSGTQTSFNHRKHLFPRGVKALLGLAAFLVFVEVWFFLLLVSSRRLSVFQAFSLLLDPFR